MTVTDTRPRPAIAAVHVDVATDADRTLAADWPRLARLIESVCTCGVGVGTAPHERTPLDVPPCPFIPVDELDCQHDPRRLHDCPRCRAAVLEDVTP